MSWGLGVHPSAAALDACMGRRAANVRGGFASAATRSRCTPPAPACCVQSTRLLACQALASLKPGNAHQMRGQGYTQCAVVTPPSAPLCSGTLVLTCGKDNQLRCVDVRRFEVRCSAGIHWRCVQHGLLSCSTSDAAALWPLFMPQSQPLNCACALQVRHTLSAPSFSVGGAWTTACFRCGPRAGAGC